MQFRSELTSSLSEVQAPLALVVAPTRELAVQIQKEARKFAQNTCIKPVVVYGGVQVAYHLRQIQQGCHLLVGTPGRLKDFLGKRKVYNALLFSQNLFLNSLLHLSFICLLASLLFVIGNINL